MDIAEHKRAMGIDWEITIPELSEAIPPAYTEWIGTQLIDQDAVHDRLPGRWTPGDTHT
jgi:hypothetical protein